MVENPRLYAIARKVTDELFGEGTYDKLNHPSKTAMADAGDEMAQCPFGPDHPRFTLTESANGTLNLGVCWDQTNAHEVAETLRRVADGLDKVPEDQSDGIIVL